MWLIGAMVCLLAAPRMQLGAIASYDDDDDDDDDDDTTMMNLGVGYVVAFARAAAASARPIKHLA